MSRNQHVINTAQPMDEWNTTPWKHLEKHVFKLQKRIYRASQRGDVKTVRRLQRLMIHSKSTKTLAVRRVTQDNQGKKTAGVDGKTVLLPAERTSLVLTMKLDGQAKPTRRIWIPKPGSTEKRPLGIPTIDDRAKQAMVKMVLEPEWEAKFEPNSYGFRPGRSVHDAIGAIFNAIRCKPKYVLDADIAKCFDRINHQKLLDKLNTSPSLRHQIKVWLKAGYLDGTELFPTEEGTPQGGVLSPLLMNVALHGMENLLKEYAPSLDMRDKQGHSIGRSSKCKSLTLVRYADDLVVLHENHQVIEECRVQLETWLREIGLEFKESKTRIGHTLNETMGKPGFNFLGFEIRQFKTGKHQSGCNSKGTKLGFSTIIRPSTEAVERHHHEIKAEIRAHKGKSQTELIQKLNPKVRGWCNYYQAVSSKTTFYDLDRLVWQSLWGWAKRRHPGKGKHWIATKYWKPVGLDRWVFANEGSNPLYLLKHGKTPITRHTKVSGQNSPFDGNLIYWATRLGRHPELPKRVARLFKRQKGKCLQCGLFFKDGDLFEVDHIVPRRLGGLDIRNNLQLLHRHCHDQKTAQDGSQDGMRDKHPIIEERNDGKLSRSVLKPSGRGDPSA